MRTGRRESWRWAKKSAESSISGGTRRKKFDDEYHGTQRDLRGELIPGDVVRGAGVFGDEDVFCNVNLFLLSKVEC